MVTIIYEGVSTQVRVNGDLSDEVSVNAGVHKNTYCLSW